MRRSVLFTLLFFYSALGAAPAALAQENDDEAAVRQAKIQVYEAMNEEDVTAFWEVIDSTASNFGWDGGPLEEPQDPEGLRDLFAQGDFDVTPRDLEVRLLDDVAVLTGYFSGTYTSTDGEVMPLDVRTTNVLVKRDGRWRVVHFHHSPLATAGGDQDQ